MSFQNFTFINGDMVRKVKGYPFVGRIMESWFDDGKEKCVVRHQDGWAHIFSAHELERIKGYKPCVVFAEQPDGKSKMIGPFYSNEEALEFAARHEIKEIVVSDICPSQEYRK